MSWSRVGDDHPIEDPKDDALARGEFINDLARDVLLPPKSRSVIFGIEDDWGLGKTSAMNLVAAAARSINPFCLALIRSIGLHKAPPQ